MNARESGTRPDMWRHPGNKSFEDLRKGDRFVTAARTMAEADIQNYAGISGDFHAYHTNEVVAGAGAFGGRIAHGLLSLSVLSGLFRNRLGLFDSVDAVSLGVSKLKFLKPVRAGDTIHAVLEVGDLRDSRSRPDSGIVVMQVSGTNQEGDKVLECEWTELVSRRNAKPALKSKD